LKGTEDDSQYFESLDELGFKLQNSDRPILFNVVNMNKSKDAASFLQQMKKN